MDKTFEDRRFYVYVYLDPRKPGNYEYGHYKFDYEPFYVGKGTGKRINVHIAQAKNKKYKGRKANKIRKILKLGMYPIIYKFVNNIGNKPALDLENNMILSIGDVYSKTGPLLNIDKTIGHGLSRQGHTPWNKGLTKDNDPRMKEASERMKGKTKSNTWITGLTADTDERVKRLADNQRGKPQPHALKYQNEDTIFKHFSIDSADFYKMYNKGDWAAKIARNLNKSLETIIALHEYLNLKLNSGAEGKAKLNYQYVDISEDVIDRIVVDYTVNMFTMKMLIEKYGFTKNVIRKRLIQRNIHMITFAERVKGKTIKEYKEFENGRTK